MLEIFYLKKVKRDFKENEKNNLFNLEQKLYYAVNKLNFRKIGFIKFIAFLFI